MYVSPSAIDRSNSRIITPSQSLADSFLPVWAQTISTSSNWIEELKSYLDLNYLQVSEYSPLQRVVFDFILLASKEQPRQTQDFIRLFNILNGGGILVLEIDSVIWNISSIKKLCESLGALLIYFGIFKGLKDKHKLLVLQKKFYKSDKKKISIIVPIETPTRDYPRVLEWLKFFHEAEILPYVELVLVFDGLHDALPLWPELKGLDIEQGFQMLRHHRKFGLSYCLQTALLFARGNYILWDNHPIHCYEFFSILNLLPLKKVEHPLVILAHGVKKDMSIEDFTKKNNLISFFLCNQNATKILCEKNGAKEILKEIHEPIMNIYKFFKKSEAQIIFTHLNEIN